MKKLLAIGLLLILAGCTRKTKVVVYQPAPADTCQHDGHGDDHR